VRVTVLGPITAISSGEQVAVSTNQRLFVAVLAAHAGRIVSTDLLIETLWGDALPTNPLASLQNLVSRLRARLVGDDLGLLVTHAPGYALTLDRDSFDRLAFEHHVEVARRTADDRQAIESFDRALDLWRGIPYAEFGDVPSLRDDAARLGELCAMAREERLTRLVHIDPASAVVELDALVGAEPYRERGHALLIEALYRTGRRRDALRSYSAYRTILLDELGLDPSPAMQGLEHDILTDALDAPIESPPASPANSRGGGAAHNLPRRRTSFVGRRDSVESIGALLSEHRLLTLVGAGGAGKTTLAVESARAVVDRFDDGVWLVDLLALADGRHVAEHVAATMGITALAFDDPLTSLVDSVRDRRALVILDNCEHIVAAAAAIADALLDGTDQLRLIATSREPLRVAGETVWHVEPLGVADDDAPLSDVLASASGRVFVDRVNAADPRFQLEERDAALIRTICHRLDGIPLALELAAARVPSLGMQQVAARLDDRFALLTSNQRHASSHHHTLRSAIAWSVELLDDHDRLLLARLSVFAGGFDLDAVEAVCADDVLPAFSLGERLAALVDRSLVVTVRSGLGTRHRLLETIREYAITDLDGAALELEDRHREWCRALAREIGDGFLVNTRFWYERLRTEFPNLRAAWARSIERGDDAGALDLAASLRWAPFNTGHLYGEHRAWIERALDATRGRADDDLAFAKGLVSAGAVAGLESRPTEAIELLEEAITLLTRLGADDEIVWCRMWLGAFAADACDFGGAIEHTRQGLELAQRLRSATGIVYLANQHAENAIAAHAFLDRDGHLAEARRALTLALEESRGADIEEGKVRAENGLAIVDAATHPARSLAACRAALVEWRRLGSGNRLIISLVSAARVAVLADDHDTSVSMLVEAVDAMSSVGWRQALGRALEAAAVSAMHRGRTEDAAALLGAASARFMTPRWYVDLTERLERVGRVGRATDPVDWELRVSQGRSLGDSEVFAIVRSLSPTTA
jgi:predicted ATPase/DNA-binding SARP family transcriptional activator